MPSSPIAPAHKRARSVDTGKATQQQPGPLSSCQSRAVLRTLRPLKCGHRLQMLRAILRMRSTLVVRTLSPHPTKREEEKSGNSSPTTHSCSGSTDKRVTLRAPQPAASKGVILVSEAFTEINAGLVIVLASGHRSPLLESELADPERDPDELATIASKAALTMLKVTSQPLSHLVTLKLPFLVVCWIATARHHHPMCS